MPRLSQQKIAMIGLCIASFLGCIDFTIVNTALPAIQQSLSSTVNQLQWVITAFLLALSSFMVLGGKLADLYGRRLLLFVGMAVFGLASLLAGLAPTIHWLIAARVLQGFGIAILYTVPIAILPSLFPSHQVGKFTGILLGVNGFGLAIGPVVGGFITSLISWHWIFYINLPLIVVSLLICVRYLPESKASMSKQKLDWVGFILLLVSIPSFVLALNQGEQWGWFSANSMILYLITVVGLIAFIINERKSHMPIIDFKLFANERFVIGCVANFCLAIFYSVLFFILPLYLANIYQLSMAYIGLVMLAASGMLAMLSPISGHLLDMKGPRPLLLSGFTLFFVATLLLLSQTLPAIWLIVIAMLLIGCGWAFILSPSIAAAVSSVPESSSGIAMGSLGTVHNLGGALGLVVGTLIYQAKAHAVLVTMAQQQNLITGDWMSQAVSDPEHAIAILQRSTDLDMQQLHHLFQQFFIGGYQWAIGFIGLIALLAMLTVLFGLKKR